VRGKVAIHHDEKFLRGALEILSNKYDPEFPISENINNHSDLLAEIVGIEVFIDETFAKFKIGQRKSVPERENVIKHLRQSLEPNAQLAMAYAISKTLSKF
jgi:transcriptional regulator